MNNIPIGETPTIDSLFSNLPQEVEEQVLPPSKGKFYSSKYLTVRPMTFDDEKALIVSRKEKADAVNTLLQRCVGGCSVHEILLMDKLFLILKLRELSYGPEYNTLIPCGHCSFDNKLTFNLDSLVINYLEDSMQEPIEITLPKTKVKLQLRFPRLSDEVYLKDEELIYSNLWRFVISVNGSDDPILISKFLQDSRFPVADLSVLSTAILGGNYGVQTKVKFECQNCKKVNLNTLPLGADFFTMS